MTEAKVAKVTRLATNAFAQPDVRMREMERLLEDGSDAALRGVLRRFATNAQGHIADEEEKAWLQKALVDCGASALPALRDYIRTESKLTYALRALRGLCSAQESRAFLLEVLEAHGPEDYRSDEAKLQLLAELGSDGFDAAVLARLLPFLHDHSDDVRLAVLQQLEGAAQYAPTGADAEQMAAVRAGAAAALAQGLGDPALSQRVAQRTAELLAATQWPLPAGTTMPAALDDAFFVDKKHIVRRRIKK